MCFLITTFANFCFLTDLLQQFQTLTVYSHHYILKSSLKVVRNFLLVKTCMIYLSVRTCQEKRGNFLFLENDTKRTAPGRVNDTVTW